MFRKIPRCPKCGKKLEIVVRGNALMTYFILKEKLGYKYYFAGCGGLGIEKTDYICQNCAREFDKDMNEIDFHYFFYLTTYDVIKKRPHDVSEIDKLLLHLNKLYKELKINKKVYIKKHYYEKFKYMSPNNASEETLKGYEEFLKELEYENYQDCDDEDLIIVNYGGENEDISFD